MQMVTSCTVLPNKGENPVVSFEPSGAARAMKFWMILPVVAVIAIVSLSGFRQADRLTDVARLPDHPRILMLEKDEQNIRKAIASEPIWSGLHRTILAECDALIQVPPVERTLTGRRLLAQSRECLRRVFYLSYAWRMTGDEKYARRAESEMLAVSAFSDWNPSHFLDVAEMTTAVAIGYDWLHAALSKDSLHTIQEAILQKGINPSLDPRFSSWLKATHNWNQVCNAGMSYGALAIFEDEPELAKKILNRSIASIPLAMKDYGPDGGYPEGYGYWGYGTSFNVLFLAALEKALGSDFNLSAKPGFLKTAAYLEHMTGPSNLCFNFSDSGMQGGLNPAMFWFADRLKDYSLLWVEKSYLADDRIHRSDRLLPATLIWGAEAAMEKIVPPTSTIWTGQGKNPVALMRTSWQDPGAIFVGFKGGSASVNHAHLDMGSFVMEADGVRWAMDFGPQDYNSLESKGVDLWGRTQNSQRWQVYRYNNLVHNTLTFDGQLQRVNGFAPIIRYSADPLFMHAQVDLTAIYKGQVQKAQRGVAIVGKQYVVIRDELTTEDRDTTLRWTLLTSADVKISGASSAALSLQGHTLQLQVRAPAKVTMKTWSTEPPHTYDAPNPGTVLVGFETVIPARTSNAVVVLLLPRNADNLTIQEPGRLETWR
jgi:hypothetical protein